DVQYLRRVIRDLIVTKRSRKLAFVGGRSVNRRNGDVVQPQVDAQLPAVMDHVVQDETAERGNARHREHLLTTSFERPARVVLRIALVHRGARSSGGLIEESDD